MWYRGSTDGRRRGSDPRPRQDRAAPGTAGRPARFRACGDGLATVAGPLSRPQTIIIDLRAPEVAPV